MRVLLVCAFFGASCLAQQASLTSPAGADKQENNRDVVIAGVGLTPKSAIRYQGLIRGRAEFDGPHSVSSPVTPLCSTA